MKKRTPDEVVAAWISHDGDPEYSEVMRALRDAIQERNDARREENAVRGAYSAVLQERGEARTRIASALGVIGSPGVNPLLRAIVKTLKGTP